MNSVGPNWSSTCLEAVEVARTRPSLALPACLARVRWLGHRLVEAVDVDVDAALGARSPG